jgi:rubrerythrin
MTLRTQRNLDLAMHSEAFTSAKYQRFAAFARTGGNYQLGDLFSDIADENRTTHFAQEILLAGLISDDVSNVQDVIRDKRHQIGRYRQFAEEAKNDGDENAASLFKALMADDELHLSAIETRGRDRLERSMP